VELSQFAKSAMKSSRAKRRTFWWAGSAESSGGSFLAKTSHRARLSGEAVACSCSFSSVIRSGKTRFANATSCLAAAAQNAGGQSSSAGSGQRAAHMTARHAASGRRAHQMWSVEICPCRIDFSRRAWAEIRAMGRSTSIRRLALQRGSVDSR